MAAPYKIRKPGSMKEAVALLVERCGGQKVAAALWKCSPQNVARLTDCDHKSLPRVDQVLLAESHCKDPIVTRFLASAQSCIVEPVRGGQQRPLAMVLGNITSQYGELLSAAAIDLCAGNLTKINAANILHESDDVIRAVIELRGGCRARLDGGGE
jgi:hypothetical protein